MTATGIDVLEVKVAASLATPSSPASSSHRVDISAHMENHVALHNTAVF